MYYGGPPDTSPEGRKVQLVVIAIIMIPMAIISISTGDIWIAAIWGLFGLAAFIAAHLQK